MNQFPKRLLTLRGDYKVNLNGVMVLSCKRSFLVFSKNNLRVYMLFRNSYVDTYGYGSHFAVKTMSL
jgi:hypothetical protein